jgi:hypothetical protein
MKARRARADRPAPARGDVPFKPADPERFRECVDMSDAPFNPLDPERFRECVDMSDAPFNPLDPERFRECVDMSDAPFNPLDPERFRVVNIGGRRKTGPVPRRADGSIDWEKNDRENFDDVVWHLSRLEGERVRRLQTSTNRPKVERDIAISALHHLKKVFFFSRVLDRLTSALEAVEKGERIPGIFVPSPRQRRRPKERDSTIDRIKGAIAAAVYRRMRNRHLTLKAAAVSVARDISNRASRANALAISVWRRPTVDHKTIESLYREYHSPRKRNIDSLGVLEYRNSIESDPDALDSLEIAIALAEFLPQEAAE